MFHNGVWWSSILGSITAYEPIVAYNDQLTEVLNTAQVHSVQAQNDTRSSLKRSSSAWGRSHSLQLFPFCSIHSNHCLANCTSDPLWRASNLPHLNAHIVILHYYNIYIYTYNYISADPGLGQGRGGAWDHRRCGTSPSSLSKVKPISQPASCPTATSRKHFPGMLRPPVKTSRHLDMKITCFGQVSFPPEGLVWRFCLSRPKQPFPHSSSRSSNHWPRLKTLKTLKNP